ncbi:MAG: hypothetical protein IPF54_26410 [Draconibacterium sp.]|nr:hypothetical protein [Draconibacterium sp.]
MSFEQVKASFGAEATVEEKIDFDTGERTQVTVQGEIRPNDIKQYLIKEEWYFDKQNSTMNVRILGICPIREFVRRAIPPVRFSVRNYFGFIIPRQGRYYLLILC